MGQVAKNYRACGNCTDSQGSAYHRKYCLPRLVSDIGINFNDLYEAINDTQRSRNNDWDARQADATTAAVEIVAAIKAGCGSIIEPLLKSVSRLESELESSKKEIAQIRLALELKVLSESIK